MENEKMGQLISELRKSNQMTQKDLAAKLHVSDKAVSKWERGLSCPDISLLLPLSDILGITIVELLNGEKNYSEVVNMKTGINNALEYVV
ncbi:MAG: helix-turn-helix transcriptional regulator [Herbinix sp.]|nr:helix-turn-helix transcriptional regulator [Herbinix sp.]